MVVAATEKARLAKLSPSDLTSREIGSDDSANVPAVTAAVADFSRAAVPITTNSHLLPLSRKSFSGNQRRTASTHSVMHIRAAESAVYTAMKSWASSTNWWLPMPNDSITRPIGAT